MTHKSEGYEAGSVGVQHPERAAMDEALSRVDAAAAELRIIEGFVRESGGGPEAVDETVADLVDEDPSRTLVGVEELLHDPDAQATPRVLGDEDPALVTAALKDILVAGVPEPTAQAVLDAIDGSSVEYREKEPSAPPAITRASALLRLTSARQGVSLQKLDYTIPHPTTLIESLSHMPQPTEQERLDTTRKTLNYLQAQTLRLCAPVAAGSVGAEAFDKTQRDRAMFGPGKTGGAGNHEPYCSKLFSGASNPEILTYVASSLSGKNILNLGGGNAALQYELDASCGVKANIVNAEPYPSVLAMNNPTSDRIIRANPAKTDFLNDTRIEPHSADEVWAVYSVPAYLSTPQEVETVFENIQAVLKPGGIARISHLGFVDGGADDPRKTALIDSLTALGEQGYLVEVVPMPSGDDTLILTAPETHAVDHETKVDGGYAVRGMEYSAKGDAVDTAQRFAEKMGLDITPEGISNIANRIRTEQNRNDSLLGPEYVKSILAQGDDPEVTEYQVREFARRDMIQGEALSDDAVSVLLSKLTNETFVKLTNGDVPSELVYLADIQSRRKINREDRLELRAHINAIRILRQKTGMAPIEWMKQPDDTTPDAIKNYCDRKDDLAMLAIDEVVDRGRESLIDTLRKNTKVSIAERAAKQGEIKQVIGNALETLMGKDEASSRLLRQFMQGDIVSFGFDRKDNLSALNLKGLTVCQRYLNNAKVLGSDALVELNEKLGIVNFGSYTQDTLNAMLDILRSDTHRRDVEVVVRGKDSDYNAALTQNTIDNDFKKTLFFEVGGDYSLESVRDLLDMHGISIRQLTFEGHGGERGLRLCSRFGLDRNKEKLKKLPGLRDLMDRIMPDRFGNKNIILHSCSQGRRYDRHGSTAEMLVDIASPDVVVEAAPRAMFARKTGREGELQFVTNRYHETAEILKKYDRYPGVSKLVTWLNHEDRRKAGTLKVSRNGTTKNRDGIVRIGA